MRLAMGSLRSEWGWALVRFTFGMLMALNHGYGKVFGGKVAGAISSAGKLGFPFPEFFGWAAALSEFAGGLLFAVGLLTRPSAAFVGITMVVAITNHLRNGDPLSRPELAYLYLVVAIAGLLMGGGRFSLDSVLKVRLPLSRK
jgi:putative oxidoreductase